MASKTAKTPGHSRSTSAVIPAIPRIFENPAFIAASSASTASQKSPPIKAPENSGKSIAGSAEHKRTETLEGREHDSIPAAATENEASSTPKQATAYIGQEVSPAQNPRVSLPRSTEYQPSLEFPPVEVRSPSKQGKGASRDSGATPTKETDRRHAVQKIAFGSFNNQSESSESSPTLSPSATSTHYTQPTPTSETRSQASKSENEQDGHVGTQDKSQHVSTDIEVGLGTRLVGPYPPGLIGHHVANFAKYQRHFVTQYVHDLFRRNDGNFTLDVVFKSGTVRYNLHSTILSQSPMFAKAIQRGVETREFSTDGRLYMAITVQDSFVTASAIEIVLKSLYGITALDIKALSQPYLNPHFFFSLFAASCLLAVPNYQILTSNCIVEMLDWRLLTETFRLCLTGQNFSATRDPYPRRTEELVASIFQPQASMLFERAISLLVQELNAPDFYFEKSSPNAPALGGFPRSDTGPKSSERHSKGEAGIVFGNMDSRATEKNRTLSCILLSLPLLVLQRVLVELDSKIAAKIIKPVITERQQRRELWARIKGDDELALVKEIHIPVDVLPNGLGLINEIS